MKHSLCPVILVAALLGPRTARAQGPVDAPYANPAPGGVALPGAAGEPPRGVGDAMQPPPPGVTDYLAYLRPAGACGPVGGSGPICCEVFLRPGVSFPMGGGVFGQVMDPGFMLQGGARSLFFNPAKDLAWTVELGLTSVWFDAHKDQFVYLKDVQRVIPGAENQNRGLPVFETIPLLPVIPSSLHEIYVHLSIGHEIYVCGNADCGDDGPKVRVGYDGGGRWGTSKLIAPKQRFIGDGGDVNRGLPRHFTDVVGGLFFAAHADYEVPWKCAMFFAGVRTEFAYIWADLLQPQNNTDVMSINLLFNFGCRF